MSERDSDPTLKGQRTAEKRRLLPPCANALEIWSELKLILVSLRSKWGCVKLSETWACVSRHKKAPFQGRLREERTSGASASFQAL